MAYGQIRSSSGRVLNLTPSGWVNNEGVNLNAPTSLSAFIGGSQPYNQNQPDGPMNDSNLSLADLVSPDFDRRNPIDYMGRKGFHQADGRILDPDGKLIADLNGVEKQQAALNAVKVFRDNQDYDLKTKKAQAELAKDTGPDWHIDMERGVAINKRNPSQIMPLTSVGLQGTGKPLTEFQGKASGYGARAADADSVIANIGKGGEVQPGLIKRAAEAVPLVGDGLGTMLNWTQSPEQQQIEQAQRNFINATLRQESGAAIAPAEFDNARKQYFPQPGDTPEVIAAKARNREAVISGFALSAGPGAQAITSAKEKMQAIFEAHKAIQNGKDKAAVVQRLESLGIKNHGIK